jgi:hypothetical protein
MRLALQLGHNATAAVLVDGAIVGALSRERIDNVIGTILNTGLNLSGYSLRKRRVA